MKFSGLSARQGSSQLNSSQDSSISRLLNESGMREIKASTDSFTTEEIKELRKAYRRHANRMEFMTRRGFFEYFRLQELEDTFLADRLYAAFAGSGTGSIDFKKFLVATATLAKGSARDRADFFFKLFDFRNAKSVALADFKRLLFSLLNSMLELETPELAALQEDVLALTPQEREEALDEVLADIPAFKTATSLTPDDFFAVLMSQPLVKQVLDLL